MSSNSNPSNPYRIGFILSGLLNVILIVLLLMSRGNNEETAVTLTSGNDEVAQLPTATATNLPPTETMLPTATDEPAPTTTEMIVPTATSEPTQIPTVAPTQTPVPTATMLPSPTATAPAAPTNVPGPDWLRYYNQFRTQSGLPQLTENLAWSAGAAAHSQYMMLNSSTVHAQNPNKAGYSESGNAAGQNGNIAVSSWDGASDLWPIDYWMTAPFHAVPMLNPRLTQTGFGVFRDASNSFKMTATLDISSHRDLGDLPAGLTYPITFPHDGGELWVLSYTLPEFPNPLTSCSGLQKPVGPPLVLQIGSGDVTPSVSQTSLTSSDGSFITHCAIDETNYFNSNQYQQQQGRNILDKQDAIVLIPARPLTVGETYTASVTVNGETIEWTFTAVSPPTDY
ncbi:CAP domain-containing protein [Candidatus Leptofilum sp.]|uniref:CAP domain-containing protein n=1 Tax=Candidatus Leptofilum sp. TaxID=3241576 RepID=UPI003B598DA7